MIFQNTHIEQSIYILAINIKYNVFNINLILIVVLNPTLMNICMLIKKNFDHEQQHCLMTIKTI